MNNSGFVFEVSKVSSFSESEEITVFAETQEEAESDLRARGILFFGGITAKYLHPA